MSGLSVSATPVSKLFIALLSDCRLLKFSTYGLPVNRPETLPVRGL